MDAEGTAQLDPSEMTITTEQDRDLDETTLMSHHVPMGFRSQPAPPLSINPLDNIPFADFVAFINQYRLIAERIDAGEKSSVIIGHIADLRHEVEKAAGLPSSPRLDMNPFKEYELLAWPAFSDAEQRLRLAAHACDFACQLGLASDIPGPSRAEFIEAMGEYVFPGGLISVTLRIGAESKGDGDPRDILVALARLSTWKALKKFYNQHKDPEKHAEVDHGRTAADQSHLDAGADRTATARRNRLVQIIAGAVEVITRPSTYGYREDGQYDPARVDDFLAPLHDGGHLDDEIRERQRLLHASGRDALVERWRTAQTGRRLYDARRACLLTLGRGLGGLRLVGNEMVAFGRDVAVAVGEAPIFLVDWSRRQVGRMTSALEERRERRAAVREAAEFEELMAQIGAEVAATAKETPSRRTAAGPDHSPPADPNRDTTGTKRVITTLITLTTIAIVGLVGPEKRQSGARPTPRPPSTTTLRPNTDGAKKSTPQEPLLGDRTPEQWVRDLQKEKVQGPDARRLVLAVQDGKAYESLQEIVDKGRNSPICVENGKHSHAFVSLIAAMTVRHAVDTGDTLAARRGAYALAWIAAPKSAMDEVRDLRRATDTRAPLHVWEPDAKELLLQLEKDGIHTAQPIDQRPQSGMTLA